MCTYVCAMGQSLDLLPRVKPPTWHLKEEGAGLNCPSWWCTFFCLQQPQGAVLLSQLCGPCFSWDRAAAEHVVLVRAPLHITLAGSRTRNAGSGSLLQSLLVPTLQGFQLKCLQGTGSSPFGTEIGDQHKIWPGKVNLSLAGSGQKSSSETVSKVWWL